MGYEYVTANRAVGSEYVDAGFTAIMMLRGVKLLFILCWFFIASVKAKRTIANNSEAECLKQG
jgi:hypothetical protein